MHDSSIPGPGGDRLNQKPQETTATISATQAKNELELAFHQELTRAEEDQLSRENAFEELQNDKDFQLPENIEIEELLDIKIDDHSDN